MYSLLRGNLTTGICHSFSNSFHGTVHEYVQVSPSCRSHRAVIRTKFSIYEHLEFNIRRGQVVKLWAVAHVHVMVPEVLVWLGSGSGT